jgi:hypothetical protein
MLKHLERAEVELSIEQPAWGQVRVSEMLKRQGLSISPAGVRCVWQRHDLTSRKHRLKAREARSRRMVTTDSHIGSHSQHRLSDHVSANTPHALPASVR